MADAEPTLLRARPESGRLPRRTAGASAVTAEAFLEGFGEDLPSVLNLETWRAGRDLGQEYRRIEQEVREAVEREDEWQSRVREEVHPRLAHLEDAPKGAGRFAVLLSDLQEIHEGLLFPGAVEACDGTCQTHDTVLAATSANRTATQSANSWISSPGAVGAPPKTARLRATPCPTWPAERL
jgi:hypothetical protein